MSITITTITKAKRSFFPTLPSRATRARKDDGMTPPEIDVAALNGLSPGRFPGLIGFEVTEVERGLVRAQLAVHNQLLAPNGYLHAAVVIGLVDTACGYGCRTSLPDDATGFTTIELKSNFLSTLTTGLLACEARMIHGGRTTQVWDARAFAADTDATVALFRCTQLVLR
jgi:1,4-dihydroxy-2-naphthoyl-CoA hydrolase